MAVQDKSKTALFHIFRYSFLVRLFLEFENNFGYGEKAEKLLHLERVFTLCTVATIEHFTLNP
jgi:hypothetical protein